MLSFINLFLNTFEYQIFQSLQPKTLFTRYELLAAAWFCLYSGLVQQLKADATVSYKTFTHKEGFEVNEVNSMQYDRNDIDVSVLASSLYLLKLQTNKGTSTEKFIKQ